MIGMQPIGVITNTMGEAEYLVMNGRYMEGPYWNWFFITDFGHLLPE